MKPLAILQNQALGWVVVLLGPALLLAAPVPSSGDKSSAPPLVRDDSIEPTLAVLEQRFADVEREVARLRTAKETARADQMQAALDQFKARLTGKYRPPITKEAEVHVVGIHVGLKVPELKSGVAQVDVTSTGKPIVLVVCAYNPIRWSINAGKDVEIKQLIVAGYHDQEVFGVPEGTPVAYRVHDRASRDYFFASQRNSGEFRGMADVLTKMTGAGITTFQGMYDYKGNPVVVGPDNADWRIEHILWDMRGLHETATRFEREQLWKQLKGLKFRAIHSVFREGQLGGQPTSSLGEFTPAGPVADTLKPLNGPAMQLAPDPAGATDYLFGGSGRSKVSVLNPKTGELTAVPVTDVPEVSWPSAVAFDANRGRLLLSSFGGGGLLYAFEAKEKKWSVLAKPGLGVNAMAYDADEDVVFGVKFPEHENPAIKAIGRYGPQGALLNEIVVSPPIPTNSRAQFEGGIQIVSVEKKLIVLIYSKPDQEGRQKVEPPRSYIVDPKTGKVLFATEIKPQ